MGDIDEGDRIAKCRNCQEGFEEPIRGEPNFKTWLCERCQAAASNQPPGKYFIQDSRQMVGNCMLFWRVNGAGYTTNLDEAWLVDGDFRGRKTDVLWPEALMRQLARPRVDHQNLPERAHIAHLLPGGV